EEAPVVDFLSRDPPVRKTVRLHAEQLVERIKAVRTAGDSVQRAHRIGDMRVDTRARVGERSQPPLDDFLFAIPFRDLLGVCVLRAWQMTDGGEDAEKLDRVFRLASEVLETSLLVDATDS